MKSDEELREEAFEAYSKLMQDKDNIEHILYAIDRYFHQLSYKEAFKSGVEYEKMNRSIQVWMSPFVGLTLGFLVGLFGTLYFLV